MNKIEEIKRYDETEAVSQSFLKKLMNPKKDDVQKKENSLKFIKGNYLDALITMKDCVDDLYYIGDIKYPSEMYYKFVTRCFDLYQPTSRYEDFVFYNEQTVLNTFREVSEVRWNDTTVLQNVKSNVTKYWDELLEAGDKTIIDSNVWNKIQEALESIKNNEIVKPFISINEPLFEEIEYQKCIYFNYKDVPCKARLDMVKINHHTKTYRVIDIKSTEVPMHDWKKTTGRSTRVDLQLAFYNLAMKHEYPNYEAEPPVLIVENVKNPGNPIVYELSNDDLIIGRNGASRIRHELVLEDAIIIKEVDNIYGFDNAIDKYKEIKSISDEIIDLDYFYYIQKGLPKQLSLWT
jgi:hypothetical protein